MVVSKAGMRDSCLFDRACQERVHLRIEAVAIQTEVVSLLELVEERERIAAALRACGARAGARQQLGVGQLPRHAREVAIDGALQIVAQHRERRRARLPVRVISHAKVIDLRR